MTIAMMQSSAVLILTFVVLLIMAALAAVILYFVIRAAVRSGIDRSNLSAFIRQIKLAELQARYEEKDSGTAEHRDE